MDDDANAMGLVRTTVELEEQARTLADRLVKERIACCVHVQRIQSTYTWKGVVTRSDEWLVEARTPADQTEACWVAMQTNHPYDVPMVEIVGTSRVNGAYARWVQEVTGA